MKWILHILLLWPLSAFAMGPADKPRCLDETPCYLDSGRSYHIKEPDDWDGQSPLPVLLHFHGWARQGDLIVKHGRISGATRRRGVLLIAPNGDQRSWDFWDDNGPDVDFAADVLEEVAKRYPIDRDRIFVSGYSFGGAMAWRYVCERGNDVAALLAISGSINQNESCAQAPREVRHVHGLTDTVMDFPWGPKGEETYPVALWREKFTCGDNQPVSPWRITQHDAFRRYVWDDCATGGPVTLDLHGRGHFIPRGWIARQLDELLGLTPSYP